MNEEEKKTIEFLKTFSKTEIDYCKLKKADVSDVLNVITKQQKEIEELKDKNKTLERLLQGNLYEMYKYYRELANSYQANCISKDKIKEIKEGYEKERSNMTQIIFSKYGKTQQTFNQAVVNEVIKVLDEILGE